MKKILLFILTAMAFSCSDDNNATLSDTALTLKKTVTYTPIKAAYDNGAAWSYKHVQYFENNKPVADSIFDPSGNLSMNIEYIASGNTRDEKYWYANNYLGKRTLYTYDNLGRIIKQAIYSSQVSDYIERRFTYEPGLVTTRSYSVSAGQEQLLSSGTTTLNTLGMITSESEFDGDKLIKNNISTMPGVPEVAMEYYAVAKPQSLRKTVYELNNLFIESSEYRVATAEENNYYIKKYRFADYNGVTQEVTFESVFDENGYITYTKGTGVVLPYEADRNLERFYYYE